MEQAYKQSIENVQEQLGVTPDKGLSSSEINKRLQEYGKNQLDAKAKKTLFKLFVEQFKSFMVLILLIAAAVSGVIGVLHNEGLLDTYIILGILLVNAIIGVIQERKAESSLEALNQMTSPHSKVLRNGEVSEVSAFEIVPGDIIIVDTGDIIPADLRLIETANLKIQESALTGESFPVIKHSNTLSSEDDIPLGDRENMAFSTGMVTYGRGRGIVVATGMKTQVGKIADMLQHTDSTETPMKRRLEELGKILGYVALGICALIFLVGVLYGNPILEMFMMAVSLAVAAIPEGLQVISTVVLAMGVQRLVKSNAIVRTLPSVESLGSATVICSDKTGTLTQNKMTVVEGWTKGGSIDFKDSSESPQLNEDEKTLLIAALLCTDANLKILPDGSTENSGDPTETAIVDIALKFNMNKNEVEQKYNRINEVPFDSERKRMTTINENSNNKIIANIKGGLDEVLSVSTQILIDGKIRPITDEDIEEIKEQNNSMAKMALRVLAIANKELADIPADVNAETIERDLTFIGLLGMIDPARPEVIEAIKKCRTAGIRPVMITGDHKVTAVAIAEEIGLFNEGDKALTGSELEKISDEDLSRDVHKYSVYARVAPEHKVRIVKAWQSHGEVVSMTGDGVNDAPALKQADIGTAMGIVGTEVAKDASDVILTDDNFATIVSAIEEGRRIYDNILKSIQFLL
ncbi:MAG: HAD-IC family P-type ATPase, partial [Dysgonamonadaceae bacterium]|nr:HAD-IC family P-type ATPase [Dysgonamonadaceae bacterium]